MITTTTKEKTDESKKEKNSKLTKKFKGIRFLILFCSVALLFIIYVVVGENILVVENYTYESDKVNQNVRIVCLADLHNKEFGRDNETLISKVKEQEPDIIAIVGDFNIRKNLDNSKVIKVLNNLKEIAPVYYVLGNHETYAASIGSTIVEDIRSTGVDLILTGMRDVEVNGQIISIMGLSHYSNSSDKTKQLFEKLKAKNEKNFTLLMCHHPEYYMWWFKDKEYDLMLAGHAHGGLVRIPFIGGVFAPEQGFLPKYTSGMYKDGESTLLLTRGLSKSSIFPRVNNPGEILVLDVT